MKIQFPFALPISLLLSLGLAGCGKDAEARYAGLDTIEHGNDSVVYRLHYRAPPWKLRSDDTLVQSGSAQKVSMAGRARALEPDTASVLEIGALTVKQVAGVNFPKYRLEMGLVRCTEAELASTDVCAEVLYAAELAAQKAAGALVRAGVADAETDTGGAFSELYARDSKTRRNRRIAFYATPDDHVAVWLFLEGYPELDETEVTRMLTAVETGAAAAEAP